MENTKQYVEIFKKYYETDALDEQIFSSNEFTRRMEKISENGLSDRAIANIVYDALREIQYGPVFSAEDALFIRNDLEKRFQDGRPKKTM